MTIQTPQRQKRRVPLWVKIVSLIVAGAVVFAGGFVGMFLFNLHSAFNTMERLADPFPDNRQPATQGTQNILLLGSDSRDGLGDDVASATGYRADTIMVAHIPSSGESVEVMSIMRDNWVTLPGGGEAKINAALAYGGVPMMVETVEGLIGARIDHVMIIDFEGFKGLTDALGGVTVNNPQAFSDRGIDFAEGHITLDGEEALVFVRARYPFADGDYSRVRNQQLYVKSVVQKLLSSETLLNPMRVQQSIEALAPFLTADEGMTTSYLLSEGFGLRNVRGGDVRFFTSPTLGTGTSYDGQSIVVPHWEAWEVLRGHFQNDTVADWNPEDW